MGDPVRQILTAEQNVVIKEDKLSELAADTGSYLCEKLSELAIKYPNYIQNLRGKGIYLAFDCETAELRNSIISKLKSLGVICGGCATQTIRLRPTLYFEQRHADIYLEALEEAIKQINNEQGDALFQWVGNKEGLDRDLNSKM